MPSTLSTFDFALKERYTPETVEDLTMKDHVFLAHVKKNESFSGDALNVPVIAVNPQGIAGSSLAVAQTNSTNLGGFKFQLTVGDYRGSVSIGDKVIKASRGQEGAFLRNQIAEVDGLYAQMAENLATYCYSNGGNSLGAIGTLNTNSIVLSDTSQIVNFEVGMQCVFSSGDGSSTGHSLRASGANALVTAVDRETGTITFTTGELAAVTSLAAADYIFREGDFVGNTGVAIFAGLGAFITATNSPAALYGMTRTSDPARLAGIRVPSADVAGRSIDERLQRLAVYMTGRNKGPGGDKVYLNPEDWQNLHNALGSRVVIKNDEHNVRWGFDGIQMVLAGRTCMVYSDRHCPKGVGWILLSKTWTMHSMGKLIHRVNGDGLESLRAGTANDYEIRLISYPALCTNAPGYNGRVSLT
jgi:hypothetical protein